MSERTAALQQAKADFVKHATGDHVMASVYEDLQRLRQADGDERRTPQSFAKLQQDIGDFNQTVRQYLPDFHVTGVDNNYHIQFKRDGMATPITIDARVPMRLPGAEQQQQPVYRSTRGPIESNHLIEPKANVVPTPTEQAKSAVVRDEQGFPKEIKYPATAAGAAHDTKFEYDDNAGFHRLNKIVKDDGTKYELITDDKDPNKGKWNVTDCKGQKTVQDLQVTIGLDGEWSRTENGKRITEKANGATETTDIDKKPPAPPEGGKEHDARRKLIDLGTQEVGKGPWQAAEKLIPGASIDEIRELTKLIKKYYQQHHDDNSDKLVKLKVGHHWLTDENLNEMMEKCPALKKRFEALQK